MHSTRTRIAPSPTGALHIGTARTALFNYVFAKQQGGEFINRIEDTDATRNQEVYEQDIFNGLEWLGLTADATYRQSERAGEHRQALEKLVESGAAYVSNEEARDGSGKNVEIIRLSNPGTTISFTDMIRGDISFDTTELGDFVIARSFEQPLYHLAVVVDDADMEITHVIRGEDHISNTPRQILIQQALGLPEPHYAHIPLILAPDRSKLSKRKHATAITQYQAQGYLPEAIINYLALLGWHPESDDEYLTLSEIIELFDITRVQKGGAVFDQEKLRWFNRQHMLKIPEDAFVETATDILRETLDREVSDTLGKQIAHLARERIEVWDDLRVDAEAGEYDYLFSAPTLDPALIPGKSSDAKTAALHLQTLHDMLHEAPEEAFKGSESVKTLIWEYANAQGRGAVLWPFRYALTGREQSPDPFTIAAILGKQEVIRRVAAACEHLSDAR